MQRSGYNEVCDVSFGANACLNEYRCLGANGREIGRLGYRILDFAPIPKLPSTTVATGGGGQATANECCGNKLWWMRQAQYVPGYNGWS